MHRNNCCPDTFSAKCDGDFRFTPLNKIWACRITISLIFINPFNFCENHSLHSNLSSMTKPHPSKWKYLKFDLSTLKIMSIISSYLTGFLCVHGGRGSESGTGVYFIVSITSQSQRTATVTLVIQRLSSALLIRWGQVAAAAVLTIVPTIILFSFIQKRLVEGLTAGAIKE